VTDTFASVARSAAVNDGCNPEQIFQLLSDPWNEGGFICLRRRSSPRP